jgi:protein-disulfide isomerase
MRFVAARARRGLAADDHSLDSPFENRTPQQGDSLVAATTLYTTLWLITNAYAAPLGYYDSPEACKDVSGTLSFPAPAQVLCVPSGIALPLTYNAAAQPPGSEAPPATAAADIAKVSQAGEPFVGDANAPVVMAYWFDYQCPFCKQEEETVLPRLIADYVDTGKVRIVFKDVTFLGPDSVTAGLASKAVWEIAPDKFREWHKAMFDKQDDENAGWGKKEDIIALTKTIAGTDAAKVEELMISKAAAYQQAMDADASEGATMGVGGTPSFLIGKQMIVGAQPYEQLKAAIDGVLAAK